MSKDKLEEIEELAMDCLIDLIDKDYVITVKQLTGYFMIELQAPTYFDWTKIREDYLFFIQIMTNEYKLVGRFPFTIKSKYSSSMNLTLDMIYASYDIEDNYTSIIVFLG